MNVFSRLSFFTAFFAALACYGESTLKVISPNQKYQLVIAEVPRPDAPDQMWNSFSICDAQGKMIQELGATEYPVIAVKWHKSGDSAMVLLHMARQQIMNLITSQKGVWKKIEVNQFDEGPNYFHLVDAESTESSFKCYYLGRNRSTDEYKAYSTEVNVVTGEARLKSTSRVKAEDLPFYKLSPGAILSQVKRASKEGPPHYRSSLRDDEPDWFGVRW